MDEISYLLDASSDEIMNTWASLGSLTVNSNTKLYRRGGIIRVMCQDVRCELHNRILYVAEDYTVDGSTFPTIRWEEVASDDVTGMYVASEGIQSPHFIILNATWDENFEQDVDFIPFSSGTVVVNNGGVTISDDALEIILADVGFPFLTFQDVEFSKAEIQRICIKPALERFYTYFPIIDEEPGELYTRGAEFCVPFPENAYACVPYYTTPGGTDGTAASGSPFSFYNEMALSGNMGIGGARYGRGVRYIGKQTPGYAGMQWRNNQIDRLAQGQAYLNYFRREKYSRKKIDGKLFCSGFSTTGGVLNFKWLNLSYNWDDVPFELLEPVARPMAKSAVLQQFGMLRQLVKTDIAGQLDSTVLTNHRKEIEDNLNTILNSVGVSGLLSIMRGGG